MSGALNVDPKASLAAAPTRLRQIALVTKDLAKAKKLLVCLTTPIELTEAD
jgi:hypothetical protein